jgi:transposase
MEKKLNKELLRNIMLFHFDQGYTPKDSYEIINLVYGPRSSGGGEKAVSLETVSNWFKRYQDGDRSTTDKPRIGRKIKISDEQILDAINENGASMTLKELSSQVNYSKSSLSRRLKRLNKKQK